VSAALVAAALAAGAAVLHPVLRRRLDGALTALTLGLTLLATFALDLLVRLPLVSAAAAFLLAALALFVREQPGRLTASRALAIGAAAGLAGAAHAPGAALALLALPRRGESARPLAVALLATAGVWAGARALGLAAPLPAGPWQPLLALFGSRQGLLYLTPVLWLGAFGLMLQLRRGAREAAPQVAAVLAMIGLHAACSPAAGSCPREQLAAALPLLAPPIGAALAALRASARRAPLAPLLAATALLVSGNLLFMQQYATDMIPRDFPLPFAQVARNQAALVARAAGAPLAWPANWLFAARHDTGPERFDAAAGKSLPRSPDGTLTVDVGRLDVDEALLLEGWSVRHPCGAGVCRAVEGRARLLLPVEEEGPLELVVRASGRGTLAAGDGPEVPLAAEGSDLRFLIGDGPRGLRTVTLRVTPPSGRALVDRLTVKAGAKGDP
jgi:hypothetical protein